MPLTLVITNKTYSSWSMRPWLLMRHFDIAFDEVVVPMDRPDTRAAMLAYAPTGKCPSLHDGPIAVWESLAIMEYLAEAFPQLPIWPRAKDARTHARSLANEMHAGFQALRGFYPMNVRRSPAPRSDVPREVTADIRRVDAAWADARAAYGAEGSFLCGAFCAADAMFAPVVSRFATYSVEVSTVSRAYMNSIIALPAWARWEREARQEPWRIERYDAV